MDNKKLDIIDAETLADMRLEPVKFCIENILPQGIAMISGAPKIGKSWLMLDWCLKIAKGEPVWNPMKCRIICSLQCRPVLWLTDLPNRLKILCMSMTILF